jgi:hypothetical protein
MYPEGAWIAHMVTQLTIFETLKSLFQCHVEFTISPSHNGMQGLDVLHNFTATVRFWFCFLFAAILRCRWYLIVTWTCTFCWLVRVAFSLGSSCLSPALMTVLSPALRWPLKFARCVTCRYPVPCHSSSSLLVSPPCVEFCSGYLFLWCRAQYILAIVPGRHFLPVRSAKIFVYSASR